MSQRNSTKRSYFLNLISSSGSTATIVVTQLALVPIGLTYLGTEKFGLWLLVNALVSYLGSLYFGIHSAAFYFILEHAGCKNSAAIFKRVAFLLSIIALVALIILGGAYCLDLIPVTHLITVPPWLLRESVSSAIILSVAFLLNLPFGALTAYLNGTQNQHKENLFSMATVVCTFTAFLFGALNRFDLTKIALLFGSGTLLVSMFKLAYVLHHIKKQGYVDCKHGTSPSTQQIFHNGFKFFIMGVTALLLWNTDQPIISNFLSLDQVTSYSLTMKLYLVNISILTIINSSLYPILGKYIHEKNWNWVNRSIAKISAITFLFSGYVLIGGILLLEPIFHFWTSGRGYPGLLAPFLFGVYMVIYPVVNLNTAILSVLNKLKFVPFVLLGEACVKIGISYTLIRFFHSINGAIFATVFATMCFSYTVFPIFIRHRSNRMIHHSFKKTLLNNMLGLSGALIALAFAHYTSNISARIVSSVVLLSLFSILFLRLNKNDFRIEDVLNVLRRKPLQQ